MISLRLQERGITKIVWVSVDQKDYKIYHQQYLLPDEPNSCQEKSQISNCDKAFC
ncbi:hypothetical protein LguiB_014297 [Lonicera macranthoides]